MTSQVRRGPKTVPANPPVLAASLGEFPARSSCSLTEPLLWVENSANAPGSQFDYTRVYRRPDAQNLCCAALVAMTFKMRRPGSSRIRSARRHGAAAGAPAKNAGTPAANGPVPLGEPGRLCPPVPRDAVPRSRRNPQSRGCSTGGHHEIERHRDTSGQWPAVPIA